ncbi:uncharacterized protein LOC142638904 [Castanea sativa]|uniref:uncharacterized protein LOC142638904 n=1 Tax=Castanea sativa TaxID=21020 RepID=UPI003F64CFE6
MREEARTFKDNMEAAKKAAYKEGVEAIENQLTEEFVELCQEYCQQVWAEALNVAGIPTASELRKPENIWLPQDIQVLEELPPVLPALETAPSMHPSLIPLPILTPKELAGSNKEKEQSDRVEKPTSQNVEPNVPPPVARDKEKQVQSSFEAELKQTEEDNKLKGAASTSEQDPPSKA